MLLNSLFPGKTNREVIKLLFIIIYNKGFINI